MIGQDDITTIGEAFGDAIAAELQSLRLVSVNVESVDEENGVAMCTLFDDSEPLPVPLKTLNIGSANLTIVPNPGSTAVVGLIDGSGTTPLFVSVPEIDKVSFTRGKTSFVWSVKPATRDDDGNPEEEDEPEDEITFTLDTITAHLIKDEATLSVGDKVTLKATAEDISAAVGDNVTMSATDSEVNIDADGSTVTMKKDLIEFNGGSLGPLVDIGKLTQRLNKLQKEIDMINTNISSHTHTVTGSSATGGAVTASTASTVYTKANISTFKDDDYKNDKITQ